MNIVLFDKDEILKPFSLKDRRIQHIIKVLKMKEGETFDAGILDASIGKAFYSQAEKNTCKIYYTPSSIKIAPLHNINLIIGIIRPVNIQRAIRDLCSLGVKTMNFVTTDKSEKSYTNSKAYNNERIRNYLIEGAEQAFNPFLPKYHFYNSLSEVLENVTQEQKIAFDNYKFTKRFSQFKPKQTETIMAIGPERGWSNKERQLLMEHNFCMLSLGERVLRTETANITAVSILLSKLGYI